MNSSEEISLSRRVLLAAVGATAAASSISATSAAPDSWRKFRRVVTSQDEGGRSVVLYDREPTNSRVVNGTRITRLWEAPVVPAVLPIDRDAGATAGSAYRDGFSGTSFYVAELPGGTHAPQIPPHRNSTLDYMAILAGRVTLALDDREIPLQAGDTIVQGGTRHTWINRSSEPCVLLFVVVSARDRVVSRETDAGS